MIYNFYNRKNEACLVMTTSEAEIQRAFFNSNAKPLLTIAWNRGEATEIEIDGVSYDFPANCILPLMANDSFVLKRAENIVSWQFNREFYCIVDHDKEVSCVGFIFYNSNGQMFISLDERTLAKIEALLLVFKDEFAESNDIKEDMLRMLLKRLIILITRVGKQQFLDSSINEQEVDLIREFNLLVEQHFKEYHQVQDYANLLNRSPKTLSNAFAKYNNKSPLQVIKERIVIEAKRLLYYTDKSTKEIAFDLGFEEPASFSRFFKNATKTSPTAYKEQSRA